MVDGRWAMIEEAAAQPSYRHIDSVGPVRLGAIPGPRDPAPSPVARATRGGPSGAGIRAPIRAFRWIFRASLICRKPLSLQGSGRAGTPAPGSRRSRSPRKRGRDLRFTAFIEGPGASGPPQRPRATIGPVRAPGRGASRPTSPAIPAGGGPDPAAAGPAPGFPDPRKGLETAPLGMRRGERAAFPDERKGLETADPDPSPATRSRPVARRRRRWPEAKSRRQVVERPREGPRGSRSRRVHGRRRIGPGARAAPGPDLSTGVGVSHRGSPNDHRTSTISIKWPPPAARARRGTPRPRPG
jgi:hypothetical protein